MQNPVLVYAHVYDFSNDEMVDTSLSAIDSEFIKPLSVLHSGLMVVAAYLKFIIIFLRIF